VRRRCGDARAAARAQRSDGRNGTGLKHAPTIDRHLHLPMDRLHFLTNPRPTVKALAGKYRG
jgi:hypothetical protein